jgi:putative zinc finger/helix-turn-helix YgiT family protein
MKSNTCRVCKEGTLREATATRTYHPNDKTVEVQLLESRCERCEAVSVSGAQHSENLRRLAARKASYGDQLMGEEYVAFRKRYGLTQRQASKIVGKGLIAFSRYENEETYPDTSTRLLIEIAMSQPAILKNLADKAGIEIPLWKEREEERVAQRQAEQEKLEAKTEVHQHNTDESTVSGMTAEEQAIWFSPEFMTMNAYAPTHAHHIHHAVIRNNTVLTFAEPVINDFWSKAYELLSCATNKGLLRNADANHFRCKSQRYVLGEKRFSLQDDKEKSGEIRVEEIKISKVLNGGVA